MLRFNPLNAELNPICHLLALLEAHHILHVSRIRVKALTVSSIVWSLMVGKDEVHPVTCRDGTDREYRS
jgi:hypothetical protein